VAQQPAKPVIGFISSVSPGPYAPFLSAFHNGLKAVGYVEGQNLAIEYRWAEGHTRHGIRSRQPPSRCNRCERTPSALALKTATETIPIILTAPGDPIALGLVASLNRPGAMRPE
jgi:putative ABC transport system substrate-binding protein